MKPIPLANLLSDSTLPSTVAGTLIGDLCIDSRRLKPGDAFICLGGEAFIESAIAARASAIIIDDSVVYDPPPTHSTPIVKVPNLAHMLEVLAKARYLGDVTFPDIIGVTGTNGKSTLVSLIAQLMSRDTFSFASKGGVDSVESQKVERPKVKVKVATIGTLGYGISGTRLTETGMTTADIFTTYKVLSEFAEDKVNLVAMEVSSHGLIQNRVAGLPIKTAVITNLTQDHLDYHGSLAAYGEAKQRLFMMPSVEVAIVNADDKFSEQILATKSFKQSIRFGIHSACEVRAENIYTRHDGTAFTLISPWGYADVISPLYGVFNISNLLAAISACMVNGAVFEDVLKAIPKLQPIPGRMQRLTPNCGLSCGLSIVVDFAHTPDGLEQALIAVRSHTVGRIWLVFGCGGNRDRQKRALMGAIAEDLADEIVLTSDNPRDENPEAILADIASGCKKPVRTIIDRKEAIAFSIEHATAGDCILIAGKGHEQYQIIKDKKIPFSDVAIAEELLSQKSESSQIPNLLSRSQRGIQ
jgi:UDP-N-acetylmuramoyl-L-alanyl-D-glutamate--2,6-diaminopimelate ligase